MKNMFTLFTFTSSEGRAVVDLDVNHSSKINIHEVLLCLQLVSYYIVEIETRKSPLTRNNEDITRIFHFYFSHIVIISSSAATQLR